MFVFDANQHEPQQTGGKHPPGNKFPFTITHTEIKSTKDKSGAKYFEVTLTSPAGSIRNNYNLWNDSDTARKIAVGQMSALCHATGIFKVTFPNDSADGPTGLELRGGKGLMDVNFQAGQEPSTNKPEGGYVEVKKIYDINGNEPGKGPAPQQSNGFTQQAAAATQQQAKPEVQSGWGGGTAAATGAFTAPADGQAALGGGWQQDSGAAASEIPPWGSK